MTQPVSHIIPAESKTIAYSVKEQIIQIDPGASVILFGSRARGDAEEESDWDFLVLTQQTETERLSARLRKAMLRQIELKYNVSISLIVKKHDLWERKFIGTGIYQSINEEGILL